MSDRELPQRVEKVTEVERKTAALGDAELARIFGFSVSSAQLATGSEHRNGKRGGQTWAQFGDWDVCREAVREGDGGDGSFGGSALPEGGGGANFLGN